MSATRICSVCSKPLAANAPQGLCPECLLKAALGTGVDIGPDSQSQAESGKVPFVAPTPEELAKLFPQLEILGFIGQGGMGAVYKARQKALDRIVALKILPPGIGKDPAFAERFTREAKALAKLNHPGIVTLYEFGQADGLFFFLMEFVDGVNLRQLLEAGRLSPREALAIVPQICDALQYAHDQGIVHRDIKPENILLDRQGRVKVADFGLAKLVGTEAEPSPAGGVVAGSTVLTEAGKVMGTPQYMAPEQREHPAEVDHRVDIYSLGVVLYQMLTGELPGKHIEVPSHRVQIDVRLDEVVLRALEMEPERRYQQASQLKTAVETISQSCPPADAGPQPADWRTWSPFQSPQVREICAHMTEAERRELNLRGALFGIWNAATFFVPWGIFLFAPKPVNWIFAPIVLLVGLAFYPLWRRMMREFLASTIWARQQGIAPESLPMSPRIILVGRRGDQAVIHWPGVLLSFVLILALAEAGAIFASTALVGHIDGRSVGIGFVFAVIFTGILVRRGLRTPVEQLTALDGPGGTGPKPAGKEWPMPLVGVRNGQRVIHWPGLLLFAGLVVAVAVVVSLTFYFFLPVKGYAPHPRGIVVGLLVGFILLTVKLQQAWTTPIERLPRLDAPERSHSLWPWIVAAVGMVLLVPVVLITGFLFLRDSRAVESVRRAAQHADQARLATATSSNRVAEVRCEGPKAYIRAELDDLHDLRLTIGSDALGWSSQYTGSTSVTATVEAYSQIKMEDGSMGRGLIFQAWGTRHYIALTPEGSVPYGEVVFRSNSLITQKDGTFTFADIRQTNGTLIPVSIRVRPVSDRSPDSQSFGPVIERTVTSVFKDVATCFLDLDRGEFCVPPTNLWADLRGLAFTGTTEGIGEAPGSRPGNWLKTSGGDLLGCDLEHGATLLFCGTTPAAVINPFLAFDEMTPDRLINHFSVGKPEPVKANVFKGVPVQRVRLHEEPYNKANLIFFQTQAGGLGVMQFVDFTDNPRGVKIRYKLVQRGEGAGKQSAQIPSIEKASSAQPGGPWTARLPSGVTVELLGVAENPSLHRPWWWPDGSLLESAPYDFLGVSVAVVPGKVTREIAVRLRNLPSAPVDVQWRFDPPCDSSGGGMPTRLGTQVADLRAIAVRVPASTPTITVRVGVPTGKRQTGSESRATSEWVEFRDVALYPKQPLAGTNATTFGPLIERVVVGADQAILGEFWGRLTYFVAN